MAKRVIYYIFIAFNFIMGLSAISVIGGGIFLIVKRGFNEYIMIFFCIGLIKILCSIIGCFCWKKHRLLMIYMILVNLIFISEVTFVCIIKFFKNFNDKLIEIEEDEKEKIMKIIILILLSAAACCLLSFIYAILYYKRLKVKEREFREQKLKGDDILQGLDYTNLNPDITITST